MLDIVRTLATSVIDAAWLEDAVPCYCDTEAGSGSLHWNARWLVCDVDEAGVCYVDYLRGTDDEQTCTPQEACAWLKTKIRSE